MPAGRGTWAPSEEVYRSVVDDLTELVVRFRRDGTLIFVNEVFCRFFGKRANEVLGTRWHPVAFADDVATIEARLQELSPANPVVMIENRVYSGTDEVRWMQFVNRGIFGAQGELLEIQAVGRDITERKQMLEALQESEERFRFALASIPVAIFTQDRALRYTWIANPRLGLPVEEAIGRTDEELLGPEAAAPLVAIKRRVLESGCSAREEVFVTRQGQSGHFDLMVAPLRDATERVVGVTCAALDITQRKQAEDSLRESERRFGTIFHSSPQPMGLSRLRDGIFLDVNEAFCRLYGYSRQEILGHTSAELRLWHAPDREVVMQRLAKGKGCLRVEMQIRQKNGRLRDVLASLELVVLGGEKYILGLLADITDQKRASQKLLASQKALRSLAFRLENVREEERLSLAREIHDTFGHALTDWKFDLSWLDQRLKEAGFGVQAATRKRLAGMRRRVEVEMESVRRIAGVLRPAVLDTLGLLAAIQSLCREFQRRTGVRCQVSGPASEPKLDPAVSIALFRILQELLTNVARHARAGKVVVNLALTDQDTELRVADDGCGISQGAVTGLKSLGILGIRERAGLLGGKVEIRGKRNRGTTVVVRLPMLREEV